VQFQFDAEGGAVRAAQLDTRARLPQRQPRKACSAFIEIAEAGRQHHPRPMFCLTLGDRSCFSRVPLSLPTYAAILGRAAYRAAEKLNLETDGQV
jgi:hypothetical protein